MNIDSTNPDLFLNNSILFFDSMNGHRDHDQFIAKLEKYLNLIGVSKDNYNIKKEYIQQVDVPMQSSNDCGLCVLYFIEKILYC